MPLKTLIYTDCPQCGAPVDFPEGARALTCPYCETRLFIAGQGRSLRFSLDPLIDQAHLVSLLKRAFSEGQIQGRRLCHVQLVYAPFWRVTGTVFRVAFGTRVTLVGEGPEEQEVHERDKALSTRVLDVSKPASPSQEILGVVSLGLRASALKLRPFDQARLEGHGLVLPVATTQEEALAFARERSGFAMHAPGLTERMVAEDLIGEQASVIYLPLWIAEVHGAQDRRFWVVDALSGEFYSGIQEKDYQEAGFSDLFAYLTQEPEGPHSPGRDFGSLSYLPLKCPNCGWDLPPGQFDEVRYCRTCHRAYRVRDRELETVSTSIVSLPPGAPRPEPGARLVHLPFWTFGAEIRGEKRVSTREAFARLAPTGRYLRTQAEREAPVRFHVPAFSFRSLPAWERLAILYSKNQFDYSLAELEDLLLEGCTLAEEEAGEMGRLMLFSMVPAANAQALKLLGTATVQFSQPALSWFPFLADERYYRDVFFNYHLARQSILWEETA